MPSTAGRLPKQGRGRGIKAALVYMIGQKQLPQHGLLHWASHIVQGRHHLGVLGGLGLRVGASLLSRLALRPRCLHCLVVGEPRLRQQHPL